MLRYQACVILAIFSASLLVMLASLRLLSGLNPEAPVQDQRIGMLERAISHLQTTIDRIASQHQSEDQMGLQSWANSSQPGTAETRGFYGCPFDLGNLSSKDVMLSAGWQFDVSDEVFRDDEEPFGGHYTGWKSAEEVGQLKVVFNTSGKIQLNVRNDHDTPEVTNIVTVFFNRDIYVVLRSKQEAQLCIPFELGDVLKIQERFGKIRVLGVAVSCSSSSEGTQSFLAQHKLCTVNDQVHVSHPSCFQKSFLPARVERILDNTRALVRLDDQAENISDAKKGFLDTLRSVGDTLYRVMPYSRLWLAEDSSAAHCSEFVFRRERVGILQVVDGLFLEKYKDWFATQRCYARAQGYEFWLLDLRSWPACAKYGPIDASMFFSKHCVIRSFLLLQEPGYVAIVIDADVVPAVLDRGVEEWLQTDADIHFYERMVFQEVAAGNYLVRNTPWAIEFLKGWCEYAFKLPKGYSSYDNGALHMHLIDTLQLEGADACRKLYNALDVDWETWHRLGQNLTAYFKFLRCARKVLGPPRAWRTQDGGKLTIWPRGHFFVVDGAYFYKGANLLFGSVFHHGIKKREELEEWYFLNIERCEPNPEVLKDPRLFGEMIVPLFHEYKEKYLDGNICFQCTDDCLRNLSCPSLAFDAAPKPQYRALPVVQRSAIGGNDELAG